MLVITAAAVESLAASHRDARSALTRWAAIAEGAMWRNLSDVRRIFPHADGVVLASGRTVTVFNIKGNAYRFITTIDYAAQLVFVHDLLTHAEYDKEKWKVRL